LQDRVVAAFILPVIAYLFPQQAGTHQNRFHIFPFQINFLISCVKPPDVTLQA
jgi:hypothetical protein